MANSSNAIQHYVATQGATQRDEAAQLCANIWFEVINRAIEDACKRKSMSAYSFFCSSHFEELATMLGIAAEPIRAKLVPAAFRCKYANQIALATCEEMNGVQ